MNLNYASDLIAKMFNGCAEIRTGVENQLEDQRFPFLHKYLQRCSNITVEHENSVF